MKIVLKSDYTNLGLKGDIVNVKPGYANNYLIPHNIAVVANAANVKIAEHNRLQASHKASKLKQDAEAIIELIKDKSVTIQAKAAGEQNKIYGSINAIQIAEAIKHDFHVPLESKHIILKEPIKTLGVHKIIVQLRKDTLCDMQVNVENK